MGMIYKHTSDIEVYRDNALIDAFLVQWYSENKGIEDIVKECIEPISAEYDFDVKVKILIDTASELRY